MMICRYIIPISEIGVYLKIMELGQLVVQCIKRFIMVIIFVGKNSVEVFMDYLYVTP